MAMRELKPTLKLRQQIILFHINVGSTDNATWKGSTRSEWWTKVNITAVQVYGAFWFCSTSNSLFCFYRMVGSQCSQQTFSSSSSSCLLKKQAGEQVGSCLLRKTHYCISATWNITVLGAITKIQRTLLGFLHLRECKNSSSAFDQMEEKIKSI